MARERVVINIEVNSDVATIEATRKALERLTKQNSELNDEYERHTKRLQEVTKENKKLKRDSDVVGNSLRNLGRSLATSQGRFAGFRKSVFSLRKDLGGLISAFGGIIGLVNKMSVLEIPLLAAGMAGISLLFKSGAGFVKLYQAAMSSLAYGAAGAAVAITTLIAAQREFQSVQFAPMYAEGAANTADRFVAASQAMKMFVDNSTLAVVGSESLSKAFGTLSKQSPVTGSTVAAFEGLMNIVAGSGGDIGKGSEKLAEFLATVQKKGLGGAGDIAKELGPDFEKIIKEAQALGIKTSDEFFKAAAEGTLGETFQKKYAGQLDALNNTLMGRFKQAMSEIKGLLGEVGDQFLQPAGDALQKIQTIIQRTILQISPMLGQFGTNSFLADVVNMVDKASKGFVNLMNRYLGTTPGIFGKLGEYVDAMGRRFEKLQDWARQFKDAGQGLIDNFFGPVFDGLAAKFSGGMHVLSDLVEGNGPALRELADALVGVIGAIGDYGNMLKKAFFMVMPLIVVFLKITEKVFSIWTKISNGLLSLFGNIPGGLGQALAVVPILYGSLILFSRFFKVFGGMFGKDMSVRANNVYVNGAPIGGAGMMGGPYAGMGAGGKGTPGSGKMGFISRASNAATNRFRAGGTLLQAGAAGATALGRQGKYALGRGKTFMNAIGGGNLLMMGGGMAANYAGGKIGGTTGEVVSGAGNVMNMTAMASMLGAGKLSLGKGALGTGGLAGVGAIGYGAYKAGDIIGGRFKDDSIKSKATSGLASAATGAAIGAAIGSFVPVIGTGVGAAIGAVVGGIKGYMKAGQARDDARNAAKSVVGGILEETDKMFAAGDVEGLRAQLAGLNDTIAAGAAGDIDFYNKKIKEAGPTIRDLTERIGTFDKNAGLAERSFGLSSDALNKLTEEAGIDPQRKLLTFRDILKLVGKTAQEQANIMRASWAELGGQALTGVLGKFDTFRRRKETASALDAAQLELLGGKTSEEGMMNFLEKQVNFSVAQYGELGGLANAYSSIMKQVEVGSALGTLSQEDKDKLVEMAKGFLDPASLVAMMDKQQLADLLGGESGMKNLTPDQIFEKISKIADDNPANIANIANSMITGRTGRTQELLNPGMASTWSSPYGSMPNTNPGFRSNNVTVNVAGVLDRSIVRQIQEAVDKSIRDAEERGSSIAGSGIR